MESLFPPPDTAAAAAAATSATFLCTSRRFLARWRPTTSTNRRCAPRKPPSRFLNAEDASVPSCARTKKHELAIVRLLIYIPRTYRPPTFARSSYWRGSVNYKHTRHLNCNWVFCDSLVGLIGRNSSSVLSTDQITDTRCLAMNRAAFQKVAIA